MASGPSRLEIGESAERIQTYRSLHSLALSRFTVLLWTVPGLSQTGGYGCYGAAPHVNLASFDHSRAPSSSTCCCYQLSQLRGADSVRFTPVARTHLGARATAHTESCAT